MSIDGSGSALPPRDDADYARAAEAAAEYAAAQYAEVDVDPMTDWWDAEPSVVAGAAIERDRLDELVARVEETEALIAAMQAQKLTLLARAAAIADAQTARIRSRDSRQREFPHRSLAAELGTAIRVNDRSMQAQIADARDLKARFSATLDALGRGAISRAHVRAIQEAGAVLADDAVRASFEAVVLERAERETPGRLHAFAQAMAEKVNPALLTERHASARAQRGVSVRDLADGMAEFIVRMAAVEAHGIHDRLTQQAKQLRQASAEADRDDAAAVCDTRSLDQIRADIATDVLLTGAPAIDPTRDATPGGLGAIRGIVQLTVPVTTLTGVTAGGAQLPGGVPVDPATAKRLAGEAPGWDRVMVHPVTGMVLAVDRYRPSREQRRYLLARDQHCRFPGCRMPARRCDVDHTHDAANGGRTEICNLACFCKRHHTLKHETDWTVRQLDDGALEWTSPTGRIHRDEPPPRVVFVPDGDPPPF
jgi:ribosomal protein L18